MQVPAASQSVAIAQVVVAGLPAVHLLTAPQVALTPLAKQLTPVFAPEVQVPLTVHWPFAVQLVVAGLPAEHFWIWPQVALTPLG